VEPDGLVINGMSGARRSGRFANAALVVEVRPQDFYQGEPDDGFKFQRFWERAAHDLAGPRAVPAQTFLSFLGSDREGSRELGTSSCPWPLAPVRLGQCLPEFVGRALRETLPAMAAKLPPLSGATLLAVESRTSSPMRIDRGEDMQSLSTPNLYPVGEGAGYAGGIVSSAIDGARAADAYAARCGGGLETL
jgi:uncharacterized FAD-dependent dehydrogenase